MSGISHDGVGVVNNGGFFIFVDEVLHESGIQISIAFSEYLLSHVTKYSFNLLGHKFLTIGIKISAPSFF